MGGGGPIGVMKKNYLIVRKRSFPTRQLRGQSTLYGRRGDLSRRESLFHPVGENSCKNKSGKEGGRKKKGYIFSVEGGGLSPPHL